MSTFNPNLRYWSGIELIEDGPPETKAARIEEAKESLRGDITLRIPPAYRDQIEWSVKSGMVYWVYPGDTREQERQRRDWDLR